MGERARLGLQSLFLTTIQLAALAALAAGAIGCGSPAPAAPAPVAPATGGSGGAGGRPSETKPSPKDGSAPAPDGAGGEPAPAPTSQIDAADATADATAPGTTGPAPGMPDAAVDSAPVTTTPPPAPLGAFPLEAIKAAKAELYAKLNLHIEGPSYRDGEIFFAADGAGGGVMRVDGNRKLYRYFTNLRPVGSHVLANGSILFGDHVQLLMQIFPDGKIAQLKTDFAGGTIEFANDLSLDAAGNIYTSGRHTGTIMRVSPGGEIVRVASGLNLPNGVEVDPQGKYLYYGTAGDLGRIALPAAGETKFGPPETLTKLGQPDGMQFDAWGNLWVACWRDGHIVVVNPEGKTVTTVGTGGAPINLTFGGKDLDTVYVTTDFKGIYKIGPVPGLRGFLNPGAAQYTIKKMLDVQPANTPVN